MAQSHDWNRPTGKYCAGSPNDVTDEQLNQLVLPAGASIAIDKDENRVILFTSEYSMGYFSSKYPEIELGEVPFESEIDDLKKTG